MRIAPGDPRQNSSNHFTLRRSWWLVGLGPRPQVVEHVLEDRALFERVDLLGEIADRALAIAEQLAAVKMLFADQDLEQGRFARTVLTQEADPLAAYERGVDAVVQD